MGMHSKTAYNHFRRLLGVVKDRYMVAEAFGLSHDWILQEMDAHLYADLAYKRIPEVYRTRISQWREDKADEWYRHALEFLVYWRGRYVNPDEVEAGTWNECDTDAGCHFWKKRGTHGALRPFGTMKAETASREVAL